MKKKLKADSVDELFEIVQAIQNGEEPEAYLKRKAEEEQEAKRQQEAAQREASLAARKEKAAARKHTKRSGAHPEPDMEEKSRRSESGPRENEIEDDDEAFERLLADEAEDGLPDAFRQASEKLAGAGHTLKKGVQTQVQRAGGFLRARTEAVSRQKDSGQESPIQQKNSGQESPIQEKNSGQENPIQRKNQQSAGSEQETPSAVRKPEREQPAADQKPERKQPVAVRKPEREQPSAARKPGREQPAADQKPEREQSSTDIAQRRERLTDTEKSPAGRTRRRYGAKTVSEEAETVGQRILRSLHMESSEETSAETAEEKRKEISAPAPVKKIPDFEKSAVEDNELGSIDLDTVQKLDRILDGVGTKNQASADNPASADTQSAGSESEKAKRHGRLSELKETPVTPDVKSYVRRVQSRLEEKGFGKKQLRMAGAATVIAVAVLVLILCVIGQTMTLHKKQENVTADAGLVITVESQPEEWCSSGELKLKVKVKSGTISSIEINGAAYEADEKGFVTAQVQEYLTEVTVLTEEETLSAQIELPMLDSSAPVVSVEKSQGEITVTASDARSGVASIWYATLEEDDWIQLPLYQQYSEPIPYEEGKTYYFCATDLAGNTSSPIVTSMVTAESFSLSETELTLFPGETAALSTEVSPANAYVADVRYESSNTDVVTVSASGLVTAVAEGGALIKVTADGLGTVTCSVTVASEQTVSISVIGDCTLGTYVGANTSTSFDAYYAMYGATYFFENVRDILENDDITFANLEGTLTDETTPEDKTYAFKGDPSYTEILQDGSIEVVTLANNHSSDYGAQSLIDTKENLTAAGIDYCIGDTIAYEEVSGVKVAFIGIYELATGMGCESQVRETIAEAQTEGAQLIIVAFHWGTEKETAADETQQTLAHVAIDCGADLVVGHHPHVLQGIEKYNGKYIVYSLGNFCFGGNTNPSDKATMIFRQTFTVSQEGAADDDKIEIIPCTLSSQTSYNDYRPTPASGTTATEIMERINEYSAAFGDITYTASNGL
ncbi:MAG: CapA family protein [Lachnospiraceae bacterium]|nr:CapA family protein [Lachnospiraceae bacterium]